MRFDLDRFHSKLLFRSIVYLNGIYFHIFCFIEDINDIPVISNLGVTSLTQTIDENSGVAAAVYDVDFTDDNIVDTHTFSATYSPTTCQDMYTIDTNSK